MERTLAVAARNGSQILRCWWSVTRFSRLRVRRGSPAPQTTRMRVIKTALSRLSPDVTTKHGVRLDITEKGACYEWHNDR